MNDVPRDKSNEQSEDSETRFLRTNVAATKGKEVPEAKRSARTSSKDARGKKQRNSARVRGK
jgi:hypothetical protein